MNGHVSVDEMFELLSHHRRRAVLRVLESQDEPLAVVDVAEEIAAREHGDSAGSVTAEDVQPIHVELYHVHVPHLADYGVIDYNQDRGYVERTKAADQLTPLLEVASDL